MENKPKPWSLLKKWLSQNRSWLIVFDNVDSINTVKPYWPSSKHGSILITSRDPGIVSSQLGDRVVKTKVAPLSANESTDFIQSQIDSTDIDRRAAGELAKLLGGLPIALCHAVGYLNNTESTVQDLLNLPGIRDMSFKLLDEHKADAANFSYELRFATIFERSLESLAPCTEAVQLLHFLALLNQDSIEEALIKQYPRPPAKSYCWQDPGKYMQAISELKSRSLIDRDVKKGILTFHRLVRWAVIRSWSPNDWQKNFHTTLDFLCSMFPRQVKGRSMARGDMLDKCRKVAAHVQSLEIGYRQGKDHLYNLMEFANLLANCGYYMYERGLNSDAVTIFQTARKICQKERGNEPDLTHALVLNNIAVMHGIRNEPKEALELDVQVVKWRKALLGPQDIELANSFNNLGTKYYDMDDLVNSTRNWEKALRIYEAAKDADEEILGIICANVGKHRVVTGDYDTADGLLTRALEIHRRVLGKHYVTSSTIFKLANLRVLQDRIVDAERLINESVYIREQLLGKEEPRVGVAYHKKASILRKLGCVDEALSYINYAINAFKKNEGNCEPGLLVRALFLKSFILGDISRLGESATISTKAADIRELALQKRAQRMGTSPSGPYSSESDIDKLVQPDFR
jgi:tetratricopeptide (TPR) repeat protein